MFNDINEVRLLGNVTADPDLRFTPGGSAVLTFSIATNRRYKKGEEWVEDVTFHNVVVWGQRAQSLAQRLQKGTKAHVSGRLQTRSWDGQDGKKQYRTEIVADEVILLARYKEGVLSENPSIEQGSVSGKPAAKTKDIGKDSEPDMEVGDIDPDDLPF